MNSSHLSRFLAVAFAFSAGLAHAQESNGTVRLLVGYSAGGALDNVARAVAERLRETLKQPVIVENKPGATQRLALSEVKRAKADGLTLILSNNAPFTIFPYIYPKLEFDPHKDFTPIGKVANFDLGITAGPAAPAGGLKEFLAWAKARPGEAAYATSGAGTMSHFVGILLSKAGNVQLNHVPYKGGSQSLLDVTSGQLPIAIDTILESLEMYKAGKVRMLATTGATRSGILPGVPTLKEQGYDVVAEGFVGIYGPANMTADKVQRITRALNEALQSRDVQKRIEAAAMSPAYASPSDFLAMQSAAAAKWKEVIQASGFTAE